MRIEVHEDDRPIRVELEGRFDAHEVPAVKAALDGLSGDLVLDLYGVNFVDSSGLAALVASHRRAQEAGTSFAITGVRDEVRLIFEITKLDGVLPIVAT
jgi:anti-sigma B factor antagonist